MSLHFMDERLPVQFWKNAKLVSTTNCWRWHGPDRYRVCGSRKMPWVAAYEALLGAHPHPGAARCGAVDCVNPEHRRPPVRKSHSINLSTWKPVRRRRVVRPEEQWARSISACMVLALLQEEWRFEREVQPDLVAA